MPCCHENKEIPRGDPRFAVAVVLRNLMRLLVDQGVLEQVQLTEIGLLSLRECAQADEPGDRNPADIDFVWSVFR